MYANKLFTKLLMAVALLALLFTAACDKQNAIKGPAEQALVEQGDEIMTVLKDGDLHAVRDVLSREAQQLLDKGFRIARGVVDVERLIKQNTPKIASWKFEQARIFTKDGAIRGKLDGKVDYADGKSGKVHMELEQQDGTWKLCGWSLEQ